MPQSKKVRRSALRPFVIALLILGTMTLFLLLCARLQTTARAATTFVVTNINDTGAGSLRQAILDANANPGADLISFSIGTGLQTITPNFSLPQISDPVVIDGMTQPGFAGSPLIELSAINIVSLPNTGVLNITAGNTTVRGLIINHFRDRGISIMTGGGNHIEGNYIGTDATGTVETGSNGNGIAIDSPNNVIGGTTPNSRNVISGTRSHGISVFGFNSTGNVIQGNYIGTNSAGTAALGNLNDGIFLATSNNTVGGTVPEARNVISGNDSGVAIVAQASGTSGNLIQGNYIGTDASGQVRIGNTNNGIGISGSNNTIGGANAGARNVVSGNGWGISIESGTPTGNVVQGNYIGVAADGSSPLGNRVEGLRLAGAVETTVGGTLAGTGNTVAFNGPTAEIGIGTGVEVLQGEKNSIRGNSIFSNGRLGIDLGNDGVTPNDPGDGDQGANNRQNFPIIAAVVMSAGSVNIQGTLNSAANTTFQVDFYANSVRDPLGFGEGARWIGSAPVTTGTSGDVNFDLNFSVTLPPGQVFTATATDPTGNTSEFSQCFPNSSAVGSVSFSSTSVEVNEGGGTAVFGLARTGGSVGSMSVNFIVRGETATAGADFVPTQGTVTFADGETSKMFTVSIIDDNVEEPIPETAKVTLSTSGDLDTLGSQSIATLSITDNDPTPNISIGDVSRAEGDSGTTAFNFPVTLSRPSSQQITVNFQTADGTAIGGGNDFFLPISNSITFAPGQTNATITILVIGDNTPEPDETFFVNLLISTGGGNILDGQGLGTILNDDAIPTVSLSVNDISVNEGNSGTTDAVFTVTMSGPSTKVVTADVFVFGETASVVTDFQNVSPKLTFAPGQTVQTFAVPVIGDNIFEGNERFRVELRNQVNALIGDGIGFGTILDDETQPSLSINDITVIEGDDGRADANFTVSLSGLSSNTVDFGFNVMSGSAVESEDFGGVGGANGIPPGFTSRTITVPIIGDTITEGDETFLVNISNVTNATIADGQGVCTIKDNESPASSPTFQFTSKFPSVSEGAGTLEITVTRSGNASSAGTVEYLTSTPTGGGVSDRSDYTRAVGTLRFAAGETTKSFPLLLTDDAFVEGNEFILVTLSNPTGGASIGQPNPTIIKIVDNDSSPSTFNPIDGSPLFVRQHYHDFLNREPDASGFTFWQDEINQCGTNAQCLELKRINVSAAFFLSIEFQETGYLVHRIYKTAYGDATSQNVAGTVPIIRLSEFLRDSQRISQGVIVGQGDWQTQLENNKNAFALEFVQNQRFLDAFPLSLTSVEFVTRLNQNAGSVLTQSERDQLVAQLSSATDVTTARAIVMRQVAENSILRQREFNRAFVLMQYYGYLRRNPDDAPDNDFSGWKFWLNKLDQFNGNFVSAEMVKAFISSLEYRQRFGQP